MSKRSNYSRFKYSNPGIQGFSKLRLPSVLCASLLWGLIPLLVPVRAADDVKTRETKTAVVEKNDHAKVQTADPSKVSTKKNDTLPPSFPIGNKISRTVQTVTGVNWLTGVVAGKVAGAVIHHKVGGKVKVKVKTYSFTDLMAGKLKSVDVSVQNAKVEGVQVGSVHAVSKDPVWYSPFKGKNKKRGLNNLVNIAVSGDVSKEDVERALATEEITRAIRGFKLDLPGLGDSELEVLKPKVEIDKGLVKIAGTLVTKGASEETGVPLTIEATPKLVAQDQIVLDNLKVESDMIVEPEKFSAFISQLINPIVRFSRYDRKTHAFRLLALDVTDDNVKGEGFLLLVPKDYKPQVAKSAPPM